MNKTFFPIFFRNMDVHEEPKYHECEQCCKFFNTAENLKTHIMTVHEEQNNYRYEKYGESSGHSSSFQSNEENVFKKHVNIFHGGIIDFKCDGCVKFFGQSSSLKKQIKFVPKVRKEYKHKELGSYQNQVQFVHEGKNEYKHELGGLQNQVKFVHEGKKEYKHELRGLQNQVKFVHERQNQVKFVHEGKKEFKREQLGIFQNKVKNAREKQNQAMFIYEGKKVYKLKPEYELKNQVKFVHEGQKKYKLVKPGSFQNQVKFVHERQNQVKFVHEGEEKSYKFQQVQKLSIVDRNINVNKEKMSKFEIENSSKNSGKSSAQSENIETYTKLWWQCYLCSKYFDTLSYFYEHVNTVHDLHYGCEICDKLFHGLDDLKTHINTDHEGKNSEENETEKPKVFENVLGKEPENPPEPKLTSKNLIKQKNLEE